MSKALKVSYSEMLGLGSVKGFVGPYRAYLQSTKAKHYIDTHTIVLYLWHKGNYLANNCWQVSASSLHYIHGSGNVPPTKRKPIMSLITVVGPLSSETAAKDTAYALGNQYSVYSRTLKDSEGYDTEERQWFVEQDTSITPSKLFGYDVKQFMARQYK